MLVSVFGVDMSAQGVGFAVFSLLKDSRLIHFQTKRHGGVSTGVYNSLNAGFSVGDSYENVMRNRQLIASAVGKDLSSFVFCRQIHGNNVVCVTKADKGRGVDFLRHDIIQDADAMITNESGLVLCVKTADCIPVFLYAPETLVVGIVHAGWRGVSMCVVEKAVRQMIAGYGVDGSEILAVLGVGCGVCCYEVGAEVANLFPSDYVYGSGAIVHLDLKNIIREQLMRSGVLPSNIEVSEVCSICHSDSFFSARAQRGVVGYGLAGIGLL